MANYADERTDNHEFNLWADGATSWQHRTDMSEIERRLVVRDVEANTVNYRPHSGATFVATDTGAVYDGDGSGWQPATRAIDTVRATGTLELDRDAYLKTTEGETILRRVGGADGNLYVYTSGGSIKFVNSKRLADDEPDDEVTPVMVKFDENDDLLLPHGNFKLKHTIQTELNQHGAVELWDSANEQFLLRAFEGGRVVIPNGGLEATSLSLTGVPKDGEGIAAKGEGVAAVFTGTDGEIHVANHDTIQAAADAVTNRGKLYLSPRSDTADDGYDESVSLPASAVFEGAGTQSYVAFSGDGHAVSTGGADATIEAVRIDQTGSGSADAIHAGHAGTTIADVDVGAAPRYGIFLGASRSVVDDATQVRGGGSAAIHVDTGAVGTHVRGSVTDVPSIGLDHHGDDGRADLTISEAGGTGAVVGGSGNDVDLVVNGSGGTMLDLAGDRNVVTVSGDGAMSIGGSGNVVTVRIGGDLTLESGSSNNTVFGYVGGTVADDSRTDSGNDASGVSAA